LTTSKLQKTKNNYIHKRFKVKLTIYYNFCISFFSSMDNRLLHKEFQFLWKH